jgi:para-nitrobenzyl esterase
MKSFVLAVSFALMAGCGNARDASDMGQENAAAVSARPVVETSQGSLRGVTDSGAHGFLGIPFAEPPQGDLRWRPPAPAARWEGTREADHFPAKCAQNGMNGGQMEGSEDCLYLNVWSPAKPSGARPVMVFIHGGGNMFGSTSELFGETPLYDGARLAARGDVVVVTLQYRLGMFGFFAHPGLADEVPQRASGNYALLDQLAALRWVQDNIASFGGDPRRVMLFGESGGATDTCALFASPLAKGLFSSAMLESGGCNGTPEDRARDWREKFVHDSGCSPGDLGCLRRLSTRDVTRLAGASVLAGGAVKTPAGPIVDGYVLPETPYELMRQGKHNHVPFVVGVNEDETAGKMFGIPWGLTAGAYLQALDAAFGPNAGRVRAFYPLVAFDTPRDALIAVTSDSQFICPARRVARAVSRSQSEPVYRYLYTHTLRGSPAVQRLGAAHGMELYFVFQKMDALDQYVPTRDDLTLEATTLGYWTRFAATGNPNGQGAPRWPVYEPGSDRSLILEAAPSVADGVFPLRCNFWDELVAELR